EVLQAITGKPIATLDAEFRKYLEIRLRPYAGTFKLPTRGFDDVTKLAIAALALDAKQPIARYIQAEVILHQGDLAKAKALYQGLIADGHDNFDLRTRLAQIAHGDA